MANPALLKRFSSADAAGWIGFALLAVGTVMMAGWLAREPSIVRLFPGSVMVFSTALCFALTGTALVAGKRLPPRMQLPVLTLLGGVIALVGGLVVVEYAAGLELAVDWPGLHRWLGDDNPYPGRMSPPTALAFVLTGAVLLLMQRVRARWAGLLVQALTLLIVALGVIGIAGWVLRLSLAYRHYLFGQMSLPTACAFIASGLALWLRWRNLDWYRTRALIAAEELRISLNAAAVLALIVSISLTAGFGFMVRQLDDFAHRSLAEPLKSRVDLFRIVIDQRTARAEMIAAHPAHLALARRLSAEPRDAAGEEQLRAAAASLLSLGFAGIAFQSADGTPWVSVGRFAATPALELALAARPASLLWEKGFVLRTRTPVVQGGAVLGFVIADQPLPLTTQAVEYSLGFAASGAVAVCGRREGRIWCYPRHGQAVASSVPDDSALPIARALAGETGVALGKDESGGNIMVAYRPVSPLGLGMVLNMDTAELYAPLREEMYAVLLLLAVMVATGAYMVHWRIAPLARRLRLNEKRLQLALDSSRSAVWDLDLRSGEVYLSEQWSVMLGGGSQPTFRSLDDLYALVHPDELLLVQRKLRAALGSDEVPYDVEHRIRTPAGPWKWIHSVGRVIERDAGGRAVRLIGVNTDVTPRKQAESMIERRAQRDTVTGLPNRSVFADRLEVAMARARRARESGRRLALMHLNLREFTHVVEMHGSAAGNALANEFARRLAACVAEDETIARLASDEFGLVLEDFDTPQQAYAIADKLIAAVQPPFPLDGQTVTVSTSVGIAFYDGKTRAGAEQLIGKARQSMFDAQNEEPNTYLVAM